MGCISSRVLSRSISFQEEVNQRFQRTSNGIPVLENLFTSSNGSDQFLAFVCTADTMANKLSTENLTLPSNIQPKPALEPTNNILNYSRSFHTVEEYDAMVKKIWLSQTQKTGFDEDDYGLVQLQNSESEHDDTDLLETVQSFSRDEDSITENSMTEETSGVPLTSVPEIKELLPRLDSSCLIEESSVLQDVVQERSKSVKGLKRKAIAKELKSLNIPPAIEFPTIASLRGWLHVGGQVDFPELYVTPKFGSYNLQTLEEGEKCGTDSFFNPELVAAFEECMQQLEVEEESLLKHMEGNMEEDDTKGKKAEEEIPSNMYTRLECGQHSCCNPNDDPENNEGLEQSS